MPSPFPGMDPYIESSGVWEDFHHDLIAEIKHAVAARLPANYVARAGERSYVVLFSAEDSDLVWHAMQSDVGITQPAESALATARPSVASAGGTATEDQPVTMHAFVEADFARHLSKSQRFHPSRARDHDRGPLAVQQRQAPKAGDSTCVNGRVTSSEKRTSWRSICCGAARECRCVKSGLPARTTSSRAGNDPLPPARSGRRSSIARSLRFTFP